MYEVNRVYIWNLTPDSRLYSQLNGTETTVTGPKEPFRNVFSGEVCWGWSTDTPDPTGAGLVVAALAGQLRPKDPPTGEKRILDLFHQPELEIV